MFYSAFVLTKKGPLAKIWLAAHLEKKLSKNQISETDIKETVGSIITPVVPIALRTSSHLLLGVCRIYNRKVKYLLVDCNDALGRIKMQVIPTKVDLPERALVATFNAITLPEHVDEIDLLIPDPSWPFPIEDRLAAATTDILAGAAPMDWMRFEPSQQMQEEFLIGTPGITPIPSPGIPRHEQTQVPPMDLMRIIDEQVGAVTPVEKEVPVAITPVTPSMAPPEFEQPGGFDLGGDIGFEPMEIEEVPPAPPAPPAPLPPTRKRPVPEIDAQTEITREDFEEQLRSTARTVRTRRNAPATREEQELFERQTMNLEDRFKTPSFADFSPELIEIYSAFAKAPAAAPPPPPAPAAPEVPRREEVVEVPEFEIGGPDFGPMGGYEEEERPTTPITPRREEELAAVTTPLEVQPGEYIEIEEPGTVPTPTPKKVRKTLTPKKAPELVIQMGLKEREEEIKGMTKATARFLGVLRESFKEREELSLHRMIDGKDRRIAAQSFYQVLVLKTKNLIDVQQEEPFADVLIRKTEYFDQPLQQQQQVIEA